MVTTDNPTPTPTSHSEGVMDQIQGERSNSGERIKIGISSAIDSTRADSCRRFTLTLIFGSRHGRGKFHLSTTHNVRCRTVMVLGGKMTF